MAQTQIYYIGTSHIKEIRHGASISYGWGSYGSWTNFKNPVPKSDKKVKYNKTSKNKINTKKGRYGGAGGVTRLGTTIPATATRYIDGVARTVDVRYHTRGYIVYQRTSDLKSEEKMLKRTFTNSIPYQYRLQYKDKQILDTAYCEYIDGVEYVYFGDQYYDWETKTWIDTEGHLPHPTTCSLTFSDCRRNFDSKANNSDGRDNSGSYVLSNVRANIMTLELEWTGLTEDEGIDLLNTLNPEKNKKGNYPYLIVQLRNPTTGRAANRTFCAGERKIEKYPNGMYSSISVTLTEV